MKVASASRCSAAFVAGIALVAFAGRPPTAMAANVCANKSAVACAKFLSSAPGDEYFGRMKLSFLTIINTFRDETIRAGLHTTDHRLISRVNFADDALHAWASKYPRDPALARSYYLAVGVFKKINTAASHHKAWQYTTLLANRYSNTSFGLQAKRDLATRKVRK